MLMLVVVALVALCYFGGNYCPTVLKKNKELLLGVVGGLVLCSFMGLRLEGFGPDCKYVDSPPNSPFRPKACKGTMEDKLFCEHAPDLCN